MNKTFLYLGVIIASLTGGYFYLRPTSKEDGLSGSTPLSTVDDPIRGIRNNNPGNIRVGNDWGHEVANNDDGEFEQFVHIKYGVRAQLKLLKNYINGGTNTVREITNKYSPSHENETDLLIIHYANALGVSPDKEIIANKHNLIHLGLAIGKVECGNHAALTLSLYEQGYALI